jgi:hypothetical protein
VAEAACEVERPGGRAEVVSARCRFLGINRSMKIENENMADGCGVFHLFKILSLYILY